MVVVVWVVGFWWVVGFVVTVGSVLSAVLRIVGLRKRPTKERETGRERKNKKL